MGSDDLFKKRRTKLQERKKETRTPKPNSFLIVSEGKKQNHSILKAWQIT